MRPVNLFLTEDGVLKLGYYGLTTQSKCFSIKKKDCEGVHSFAPEVFRGEYEMKSDVWSFGIALIEVMGIRPYSGYENNDLPTMYGRFELPFKRDTIKSSELVDFLNKCFVVTDIWNGIDRWSVKESMNVSAMG